MSGTSTKKKDGTVAATSRKPQMTAPPKGIKIRMYRHGLGDSFLLAFQENGQARYLLIDCGIHTAQTGNTALIHDVAKNIASACGGRLDYVVVTHEHTDHVSGFVRAYDVFKDIELGEVWLGWTENQDDAQAARLRESRQAALSVLKEALKRLKEKHKDKPTSDESRISGLIGFFDGLDEGELGMPGLAAVQELAASARKTKTKASGSELAFYLLRKQAKEGARFLEPTTTPWKIGELRFFVLGPPRDEKLLTTSDPSSGEESEVYLEGRQPFDRRHSFAAALRSAVDGPGLSKAEEAELELFFPFDECHRVPIQGRRSRHHAAAWEFYEKNYQGRKRSKDGDIEWRQIDEAWLGAAGELALHLEADTNNTSLAIAIELCDCDGKVLLFPGDAQVGSWLSWGKQSWIVEGKSVGIRDLFKRMAFYKVSHHASHNGTLKKDGLELMGDDFVAMIPVHRETAAKLRGWNMPYGKLLKRLEEKTAHRVLRSDREHPLLKDKTEQRVKPANLTREQWASFGKTTVTKLYFEMTIG